MTERLNILSAPLEYLSEYNVPVATTGKELQYIWRDVHFQRNEHGKRTPFKDAGLEFRDHYKEVHVLYYNSAVDNWYRLIYAMYKKSGLPLYVNKHGDVFLERFAIGDHVYGIIIKYKSFDVIYLHAYDDGDAYIANCCITTVGKDVFTLIDREPYKEKYVGAVPNIDDYYKVHGEIDEWIVKDAVEGCMKMPIGLFDVVIRCVDDIVY